MRAPPEHPPLGAFVAGFASFVIARILEEHLPSRMVSLQRLVEAGRVDPALLAEVTATWSHVWAAGEAWATWRASVDGKPEVVPAEMPAESAPEIDTATAATILRVSESRVRQLARAGHIGGRRVGRMWLVSRTDVELRRWVA